MSTNLSNDAQLRYIIEWFQEWSEMQRGDFLGILLEKSSLVNGLLSGIEGLCSKVDLDRPPSLFQCRVKLFREWSQNWSQQEKDTLISSIKNIDPKFAEQYDQRLSECTEAESN